MYGGGNPETMIKIRQQLLKNKITELKGDIHAENDDIYDVTNPNLYGIHSDRTKMAEDFVKSMQKKDLEGRIKKA